MKINKMYSQQQRSDYSSAIMDRLWQLRLSETLCDTLLQVEDNSSILCHSAVLAAASDKLCSLLTTQNCFSNGQTASEGAGYILDCEKNERKAVELILEYIYTGDIIKLISSSNVCSVNLIGLIELCRNFGLKDAENEILDLIGNNDLSEAKVTLGTANCTMKGNKNQPSDSNKHNFHELDSPVARKRICKNINNSNEQVSSNDQTQDNKATLLPCNKLREERSIKSQRNTLDLRDAQISAKVQFSCYICDKKCLSKASMLRHIKCTHNRSELDQIQPLDMKDRLKSDQATSVCKSKLHNDSAIPDTSLIKNIPVQHVEVNGMGNEDCSTCLKFISEFYKRKVSDGSKSIPDDCTSAMHNHDLGLSLLMKQLTNDVLNNSDTEGAIHSETCKLKNQDDQLILGSDMNINLGNISQKKENLSISNERQNQASQSVEKRDGSKSSAIEIRCHKSVISRSNKCLTSLKFQNQKIASMKYSCSLCEVSFTTELLLKRHMKSKHKNFTPQLCSICGKGFKHVSNLQQHIRTHTGERPFGCLVCKKNFLQKCSLKEHERVHLAKRDYICETCGKQFRTGPQLYSHAKIHAGVKSHMCKVCEKSFLFRGELCRHERIHSNKFSFVCEICGKGFKFSSNLHSHMRSHAGCRAYTCNICFKSYIHRSHMIRHQKLHEKDEIKSADDLHDSSAMDRQTDTQTELPLPIVSHPSYKTVSNN